MIEIKDKVNCTGCYACYNICPKQAITLKEDREGFKYPEIDKEKCINCGLCDSVCPVLNKTKASNKFEKPIMMAAWSRNTDTRLDSTSGGVFSEIANKIFEQDGYVCGAVYDENFMVKHVVTNNKEQLPQIRSSKYLQSDINNCFKTIKKLLIENKKVLICASPCQVAGLYNYLGKDYENLITCDFICRGINSPKIFKGYINSLEAKYKSKVKAIKFKNKIHGWHNFSTKIDFENGKTYIGGRYLDSYMIGYLKYNAFMRPACYKCRFKDLPRKSDITLADFWGIEKIDPKLDNNQGTSLVLLNTRKGEELFKKIECLEYTEITSEQVFKENVFMNKSVEKTESRANVFDNIDNMTYSELSKNFFPEPKGLDRMKIIIKNSKGYFNLKKVAKKFLRK